MSKPYVTADQERLLRILAEHGPLDHFQLIRRANPLPTTSIGFPSDAWSRREVELGHAELMLFQAGLIGGDVRGLQITAAGRDVL